MTGSTTNIGIRKDSDLKAQADALFGKVIPVWTSCLQT